MTWDLWIDYQRIDADGLTHGNVRNRASVAHPNPTLLDEPEATLVINSARTVLAYLDAKLRDHEFRG